MIFRQNLTARVSTNCKWVAQATIDRGMLFNAAPQWQDIRVDGGNYAARVIGLCILQTPRHL